MNIKDFDVEYQYQQYLLRVGLNEYEMGDTQRQQLRQTFYAATGQTILLFRDDLPNLSDDEAVQAIKEMINQIANFFQKENGREN